MGLVLFSLASPERAGAPGGDVIGTDDGGTQVPADPVACTMDAKVCPDGSYVGRVAPNCEFAACPSTPPGRPSEPVVCTDDAKVCPDGTAVGRVGPNCEFAVCPSPGTASEGTLCTPASRETDVCIELYAPVCGLVEVQCVTTPCNPQPQTYSNSCFACADDHVISYTEGACGGGTNGSEY
ncbi:MAG: hypothetical protein AAB388_03935 [Patescibacteria group bacterium]